MAQVRKSRAEQSWEVPTAGRDLRRFPYFNPLKVPLSKGDHNLGRKAKSTDNSIRPKFSDFRLCRKALTRTLPLKVNARDFRSVSTLKIDGFLQSRRVERGDRPWSRTGDRPRAAWLPSRPKAGHWRKKIARTDATQPGRARRILGDQRSAEKPERGRERQGRIRDYA